MTLIQYNEKFFIYVKWKSGFKHIWPCFGFELKSLLDFLASLGTIESFNYKKVSETVYSNKMEKGNLSWR